MYNIVNHGNIQNFDIFANWFINDWEVTDLILYGFR